MYVVGLVEATSAEEAKAFACRVSTSKFEWFVGGGRDCTLGNNRIDVMPETLEVHRVHRGEEELHYADATEGGES